MGSIVYVFGTLIVTIIMMNILISVVSDHYTGFQMNKPKLDIVLKAELLHVLSSFYSIFPCKKHSDEMVQLWILRNEGAEEAQWKG